MLYILCIIWILYYTCIAYCVSLFKCLTYRKYQQWRTKDDNSYALYYNTVLSLQLILFYPDIASNVVSQQRSLYVDIYHLQLLSFDHHKSCLYSL